MFNIGNQNSGGNIFNIGGDIKTDNEKQKFKVEITVDETPLYPNSDTWKQYRATISSTHDFKDTGLKEEFFGDKQEDVFIEACKNLEGYFRKARACGKI